MAEQTIDKLIIDISVSGNASSEIGKINTNLKNMGTEGKKSVKENTLFSSLSLFTSKLIVMGYALKKVVNMFSGFVTESTKYTENLNLFRVTFGELANEAENFATSFADALGLDVSQVMRNMGFFNQISTGFGLASDEAYKMSETLTQISYDISSFFDLPIDDAISKVQSGLAGELEPLRRIGYALDQATLQQIAYNLGIEKSIRDMTQAEKAQLRTIAIYEQSKNVMGDLAETIESPANQLRILQQQFVLLARSIGNIIVPILNKVIPYINGFVQGLTTVFNQIALIFGFELGQGARDSANSISEVSSAIEETEDALKKTLLPFDKFLSLAQTETEDTSSSFTLEIPTYDALAGLDEINKKIEEISTNVKNFFLNIDDNGVIKGLSDNFYALLAVVETIIATKIIGWISSLVASMRQATLATNELTVAQKLLQTAGLFLILYSITQLVAKWDEMSDATRAFYIILGTLGAALTIFSNTTLLKKLIPALKTTIFSLNGVQLGIGGLAGVLAFSIFDGFLSGLNKTSKMVVGLITVIGALIIGLITLKAVGSFGAALPALLAIAGVAVAGGKAVVDSLSMPSYATGGFTPEVTGSLFQAGENGRPELMGSVRGKNAVANVQSIESAMENAAYRGMARALSSTSSAQQGSQKDIVLNIDGKELTRATVKNMASELNKNYRVNFATR